MPARPEPEEEGRYEDLGPIAAGGMGEVRRVRDRVLGRIVAMKVLLPERLAVPDAVARFVEEARTAAALQHPGLIPVHELGWFPDGRPWFTMEEVRGRTLADAIRELHEASDRTYRPGATGLGLIGLLEAVRQVCAAVGFAHARGVVHRDLKPSNVMLGRHGEVRVVDWGIARIGEAAGPVDGDEPLRPAFETQGRLTGTPRYMAPEQVTGGAVGPQVDVWALGCILYELLSGRAPYASDDTLEVLAMLASDAPIPAPSARTVLPVDPALDALVAEALRPDPLERLPHGCALAERLGAWLDGESRRQRAEERAAEARALLRRAEEAQSEAEAAERRATALLRDVGDADPEERKAPGWAEQDRARELRRDARRYGTEAEIALQAALADAPDAIEIRLSLAARHHAAHAAAEAVKDHDGAERAEGFLRAELAKLPDSPERRAWARWLEGTGELTLVTDPPGALVRAHRYVLQGRRLVTRDEGVLGTTPLHRVPLGSGSWLLTLEHPDRELVRYPVFLERAGVWDGVPPEGGDPVPVWLPPRGSLASDDCYVPAGWFRAGDEGHPLVLRWADALVAKRGCIDNAAYITFLDDLVRSGQEDLALELCPRDDFNKAGASTPIYGRRADGTFHLQPDADGDLWEPDWPVMMLGLPSFLAYAAWRAERDGLPWRLPASYEWEKAARGVDGRRYPWGDFFDASWVCVKASSRGRLASPSEFPVDEGPFGLRHASGNVSEYVREAMSMDVPPPGRVYVPEQALGPQQMTRGGAWASGPGHALLGQRGHAGAFRGLYSQGARLVRSVG
ncbi:MAG: SUMF1/EgtB/PvdO family nonheme iron enzyme [Alphaproteobacteria bacterium]|nr:SUMF1/EgtB/PvdO family nonheme iron enzyme [Alphaproteobacteria bacterium]